MINHSLKSTLQPLALIAVLSGGATSVNAEPADWRIDDEHFSIAFEVEHIGYQQQMGLFLEASGSFRYDPESNELLGGTVEIAADSIFTNLDNRDDHLRGRDFLNARRHPDIVFNAAGFSANEDNPNRGVLSGSLTMLDQTHPVELQVVINKRDTYPFGHRKETLGISAQTTIKRSQWGMDYGVGNKLVGDDVALRFELEAIRQ